jgi:hypothetical protein
LELTHASGSNKQAWQLPDAVLQFWALDDGRRNRPDQVEHWQ